jgi:hypothetical protein
MKQEVLASDEGIGVVGQPLMVPGVGEKIEWSAAVASDPVHAAFQDVALGVLESLHRPLSRAALARLRWYYAGGVVGLRRLSNDVDQTLLAAGLIGPTTLTALAQSLDEKVQIYRITEAGELALAVLETAAQSRWTLEQHLASRLVDWLHERDRMAWEGLTFTAGCVPGLALDCRPDVYSLTKRTAAEWPAAVVYIVRASREGYLAGRQVAVVDPAEQLRAIQCVAGGAYYVLPAGLVAPAEIPDGYGFLEETAPGRFVVARWSAPAAHTSAARAIPHGVLDTLLNVSLAPRLGMR